MGYRFAYVDNFVDAEYVSQYMPQLIEEFQTNRPNDPFLFMPECVWGNVNHPDARYAYKYGPAWGRGVIGTSISDLGYRQFFAVDDAHWVWANKGLAGIKSQLHRAFDVGHIVSPWAWWVSRGYEAVVEVLAEREEMGVG